MGAALVPAVTVWCAVAGGLFLGLRWASAEVAEALMPWQRRVLGGALLTLAALGPAQALSPWTLAIPGSPVWVCAASGLAWIALLAALAAARASRVPGWVMAIIFAVCAAPVGAFGAIWLLFQPDHDVRGRISPTLTYEILSTQAWGGGRQYSYVVYRSPRSVPFVRRKAAEGKTPCDPSDVVSDPWKLEAGFEEKTVVISCDVMQPPAGVKVERREIAIR